MGGLVAASAASRRALGRRRQLQERVWLREARRLRRRLARCVWCCCSAESWDRSGQERFRRWRETRIPLTSGVEAPP
jgi:hypothetical protein